MTAEQIATSSTTWLQMLSNVGITSARRKNQTHLYVALYQDRDAHLVRRDHTTLQPPAYARSLVWLYGIVLLSRCGLCCDVHLGR